MQRTKSDIDAITEHFERNENEMLKELFANIAAGNAENVHKLTKEAIRNRKNLVSSKNKPPHGGNTKTHPASLFSDAINFACLKEDHKVVGAIAKACQKHTEFFNTPAIWRSILSHFKRHDIQTIELMFTGNPYVATPVLYQPDDFMEPLINGNLSGALHAFENISREDAAKRWDNLSYFIDRRIEEGDAKTLDLSLSMGTAAIRNCDLSLSQSILGQKTTEALTDAAFYGQLECVKVLVKHGAKPTSGSSIAIRTAAAKGYINIVKELFELSSRPARDTWTIIAAEQHGHFEIVDWLLPRADFHELHKMTLSGAKSASYAASILSKHMRTIVSKHTEERDKEKNRSAL